MALAQALGDNVPPPMPRPKGLGAAMEEAAPAEGRQGGGFFSNPAVQAFLLQMAAEVLAGNGLGAGLGEGFAAAGRYGALEGQRQRQEAQDAREREVQDREYNLELAKFDYTKSRGAGAGGGKGSGKAKTDPLLDPKTLGTTLYDSALAAWKEKSANSALTGEDPGPMPDKLTYQLQARKVAAAVGAGMPMGMWNDLRANGRQDQADFLTNTFITDPAKGKKIIEGYVNPESQAEGSSAPAIATPAPVQGLPAMPPEPTYTPATGALPSMTLPPLGAPKQAVTPDPMTIFGGIGN